MEEGEEELMCAGSGRRPVRTAAVSWSRAKHSKFKAAMSSCICSCDKFDVEEVNAAKFGGDIKVAVAADDSGIDVMLGGVLGGDIRLLSSMPLLVMV